MMKVVRNNKPPPCMSHLIDIELVLPPRQLSVAGGELANEVMAADKQHPHTQASMNTDFII